MYSPKRTTSFSNQSQPVRAPKPSEPTPDQSRTGIGFWLVRVTIGSA